MLRINKKCKVCQAIKKGDKKLVKRIQASNYYDKSSSVKLADIQREYKDQFSIRSLYGHAQKHQGLTTDELTERRMNQIVKEEENKQLRKMVAHGDIRQTIMDIGLEQIESGEIKLRAPDVLRAAEGQALIEEKAKDREAAMMRMIFAFASGEISNDQNPSITPGESAERIYAPPGLTNSLN